MNHPARTSPGDIDVARWYLRARHRAAWNVPIAIVLTLYVIVMLLRSQAQDAAANLVNSRAELMALAPVVAPEVNARLVFEKAVSLRVLYGPRLPDPGDPDRNLSRPGEDFDTPALQAYLQANTPAILQFRAAADMKDCSWNTDFSAGPGVSLTHLTQIRHAVRLLAVSARMNAHAGRHTSAAADIAAMYKLGCLCEKDPIMISALVSIACCSFADSSLEAILAFDPPTSEADVQAYRDALWVDRRIRERYLFSMKGERAFCLYTLDMLSATPQSSTAGVLGGPEIPNAAIGLIYGSERNCARGTFDGLLKYTRERGLPPAGTLQTVMDQNRDGPSFLCRLLIPSLDRTALAFQRSQEYAYTLQLALAVQAFRLRHQRDPKSLSELVPEFLPAIPVSVFGGGFGMARGTGETKPSTTSKDVGTFFSDKPVLKIYSFWQNGTDDAGNLGTPPSDYDGPDHAVRLIPYSEEVEPALEPSVKAPAGSIKPPAAPDNTESLQEQD